MCKGTLNSEKLLEVKYPLLKTDDETLEDLIRSQTYGVKMVERMPQLQPDGVSTSSAWIVLHSFEGL